MKDILDRSLVVIPAFNEEEAIGPLLEEIRDTVGDTPVLVVDDCSRDRTAQRVLERKALLLRLSSNLGVGGAAQAGFRYAWEKGFRYAIRCDADGQHPPSGIPLLAEAMASENVDLVAASRYLGDGSFNNTIVRSVGIWYLSAFLSYICKKRVTDPTSGFQMLNRPLLYYFTHRYPMEYPEPESLALIRRQGYHFCEVPVQFRERMGGTSSIGARGAVYYAFKVTLALIVDRARSVDQRYARHNLAHLL
jgi:glycosyltransferase involved in cell wall biosynthesis